MRLYYHPVSSNSRRVLLTAIILEAKLELITVDLLKGEHRTGAYLRINPNGKVPLLDDDGFLLWESHAIMQYLADKRGAEALYPQDIQLRADINRWLFWSAYHFTPAVGIISRERISKKMVGGTGGPDPAEIARGEALIFASAKVLDEHLADKQWVAQDRLTLADLAIASPLMHTEAAKLPIAAYEHLQRWFAQVRALDAWQKSEPARSGELRARLS
ncbi:glutathione S-transferase family protein [Bordetella petrii]|uniref:glutathione S-transferase family protein n=1 Tax=Bordetella petrii TaxID=94624 RepID=UPI001A978206|nr:glutathione S-transferase family protein [Bordetella petrii]MBO1114270.1 glutathione S-transferase family protein [Bordetella petrii]